MQTERRGENEKERKKEGRKTIWLHEKQTPLNTNLEKDIHKTVNLEHVMNARIGIKPKPKPKPKPKLRHIIVFNEPCKSTIGKVYSNLCKRTSIKATVNASSKTACRTAITHFWINCITRFRIVNAYSLSSAAIADESLSSLPPLWNVFHGISISILRLRNKKLCIWFQVCMNLVCIYLLLWQTK